MVLALMVYAASVLGHLHNALITAAILCCAGGVLLFIIGYVEDISDVFKFGKRSAIVGVVCGVLSIFIPSERTMYLMAGAYAAQSIAENPRVNAMSDRVLKVIEKKLDDAINEGAKKLEKAQ